MDINLEDLGKIITDIRKRLDLTTYDMADKAGTTPSSYIRIEKNTGSNPSFQSIHRVMTVISSFPEIKNYSINIREDYADWTDTETLNFILKYCGNDTQDGGYRLDSNILRELDSSISYFNTTNNKAYLEVLIDNINATSAYYDCRKIFSENMSKNLKLDIMLLADSIRKKEEDLNVDIVKFCNDPTSQNYKYLMVQVMTHVSHSLTNK